MRTYDDVSLVLGGWTVTGRALYAAAAYPWTTAMELRWAPLQDLSLYTSTSVTGPWVARVGCVGKW